MPLDVLVSPGCSGVSREYVERVRQPGHVFIDTGLIFTALTGSTAIPSALPEVLRVAQGLRTTAVRFARDANLSGLVRTGNGSRAAIQRLQAETGGGAVKVLAIDREEACKRVRELVTGADRVATCEQGLDRFYDRYQPDPSDEVVS